MGHPQIQNQVPHSGHPAPRCDRKAKKQRRQDVERSTGGEVRRRSKRDSSTACPGASRKSKSAGHFARNDAAAGSPAFPLECGLARVFSSRTRASAVPLAECGEHARASPCGKQRRQAAALHMRRPEYEADGREVAQHVRRAWHAMPLQMQNLRQSQFFGVAAEIFLRASSRSFASVQIS